jgi:hypothetical protein
VLARYGIPRDEWPKYDVDHNPPYDPDAEPDHRKYTLIPRLHSDHASKTAREDTRRDADGRFQGGRQRGAGVIPVESNIIRTCELRNKQARVFVRINRDAIFQE